MPRKEDAPTLVDSSVGAGKPFITPASCKTPTKFGQVKIEYRSGKLRQLVEVNVDVLRRLDLMRKRRRP